MVRYMVSDVAKCMVSCMVNNSSYIELLTMVTYMIGNH